MKNALIGEEYLDPSDRDKNVNKVLKFLNENMENDLKDVDKENLVPDPTISFNEIKEEYKEVKEKRRAKRNSRKKRKRKTSSWREKRHASARRSMSK